MCLPADSHLGVYDVHTLYPLLCGMGLYPRSRVLRQLSTTPNVAVRLSVVAEREGFEPPNSFQSCLFSKQVV